MCYFWTIQHKYSIKYIFESLFGAILSYQLSFVELSRDIEQQLWEHVNKIIFKISILFILVFSAFVHSQETAKNLFSQYRNALYQIQIIDKESGNKTSIGSGFRVGDQGDVFSNYHVIAEYIYNPDKFRIQFLNAQGQTGELRVIHFDVINDIALLQLDSEQTQGLSFTLAQNLPQQGSPIFSLGNPHDLGMIVVPGTFNGLKKNSFYKRIHFTGSINPGMSGGPAVNQWGEVVGVNVATAGNQIGFLIPLPKLKTLFSAKTDQHAEDFKQRIEKQLLDNQSLMISEILQTDWKLAQLGKANIPEKVADFISCWGGSNANDKDVKYLSVANRCRLGQRIFLNSRLQTGEVEIEFEWLQSDSLNQFQFSQFLSQRISGAKSGNNAGKPDVTNYQCHYDEIKNNSGLNQKAVQCIRAYHDFDNLYDVLFISASINHKHASLISHFTLAGVSEESTRQFTQQFLDSVSWQ